MRIHRSHPDDHFTIIPNATLRDQRLSALARCVLVELLSHSDNWETNADAMWRHGQEVRGEITGEGRRAYRAAFTELEKYGYMVRRTLRGERGRFITVLEVYDTPGHQGAAASGGDGEDPWSLADRGTADGTPVDGTSADGSSVTGTSQRNTNQRSTKEEEPSEEDSSSLPDGRAAAVAAREKRLQTIYSVVDRLSDETLKSSLLKFERHRPRVYRQCRQKALAQLERADTRILNRDQAARDVDRLSFKYGVLHYEPKGNWPGWMSRPLEEQYRRDQQGKAS